MYLNQRNSNKFNTNYKNKTKNNFPLVSFLKSTKSSTWGGKVKYPFF